MTINHQNYELSTQNAYPTQEMAWSDKRKKFIMKQIDWQMDEGEKIKPIYFELGPDKLFPLQARYSGVTFHRVKNKQGIPQPNITVQVEMLQPIQQK